MNKTISIFAALVLLMISGCDQPTQPPPIAQKATSNGYQVASLFEFDGCKVYRFTDDYKYRYFARCKKQQEVTSEHSESCGKGCTRHVQTTTVQEDEK